MSGRGVTSAMGDMLEEETTTAPDEQTDQPGTDALGDPGKAALAAERRARRDADKARAAAEARVRELEDRDKSDAEKLAQRAAEAERRAVEAEQRALRLEVASAKGLTAAQARRLVGETREEIETDADDLLAAFGGPAGDVKPRPARPKPDPSQGPRGGDGAKPSVARGREMFQSRRSASAPAASGR